MRTDVPHPNQHDKAQCRRDVILRQLLVLVREIEEYDKCPKSNHYKGPTEHKPQNYQHADKQPADHGQQALQQGQQSMKQEDPSCCVGNDLLKDEYFLPMTVDGQPARPVVTRKAGQGPIKWCPPCYEIVPKMDYTISCYRPLHKRNQQEMEAWRPEGHLVDHGTQHQGPQERTHDPSETKQRFDGKEHHGHHETQPNQFGHHQPEHHIKDQFPEGKGHNTEYPHGSQRTYKCYYDPIKESSRRVSCKQENNIHGAVTERQRQPYSGKPDTHQEPLWEGGDGIHHGQRREEQQPGDKHPAGCRYDGSEHHHESHPGYRYDEPKHQHEHQAGYRHDESKHFYEQCAVPRSEEPKHHLEHQCGYRHDESKHPYGQHSGPRYEEPKRHDEHHHDRYRAEEQKPHHELQTRFRPEMHHPDSFQKTAVMLKPKEDFRHQVDESKYYPVLIPKDVIWPKHKEDHITHKSGMFDESKYAPVLIPKEAMGPVGQSLGKVHHGRPEKCYSDKISQPSNGRQYPNPKELPNNQRRNGLAPDMKEEQNKGSPGQSIFCYEDRVRKEGKDDMNWDVYGGQKCAHVHPPPSYFTYSCPEDKKHNHWSPPETTICRYPNTCMASCFDHPVLNNWVYQQPSNRFYLQRRDYTPF